eukprot:TRINITY_DN16548_c0_g1_i1.p1 TRINITY_DN16548_c0_g1~~TRINITY_DN16548_c0_g1_i1.p1  ORF type:complete len:247 (-),score=35.49 TRINITY_DN16548_c0_g1_i1:448-1188(-)
MEGASQSTNPRTVEDVFKDFKGRRMGMLKALTTDVDEFFRQCDPDKENLCLYGFPDEAWEVNLPADEVPPELPEPALGINFARNGMQRKDWLSLVAVHSDVWLLAVAFFYGARLDKNERKRLFNMVNELPTVFDIVTGRKPLKDNKPSTNNSGTKNKHQTKMPRAPSSAPPLKDDDDTVDDDEEEHGDTTCGICGVMYAANEFWIGCDFCQKWFHGKCVKVTSAKAEGIDYYKCPSCVKRPRISTG